MDTLRADYLSCYGSRGRGTPNIDAIAKGGTLFSQVTAQVPLTLPSHVSLLTSTYPFANGVEDNGQLLPPGAVTLAGVLKARGYKTAAFIGSFVLDRRFGLNQGFDVYDSPFALSGQAETDVVEVKRLGEDVTRSASAWIDKNSGSPFFVFVHLFDLHTPENLPPAVRARFPGPRYDAELGYVDEVLGKFWNLLRQRGVLDKALVVFLSDHGESLGEHGENTHGYFIYQSTLAVPLIFHWPAGSSPGPPRIDEPVSLLGVAPTILQSVNIPVPASFQGKGLSGLSSQKRPPGPQEIYSESLYSHNHFSTSALLSLRIGNYKYIQAPKPEFYDLSADPVERTQCLFHPSGSSKRICQTAEDSACALRAAFSQAPRSCGAGNDGAPALTRIPCGKHGQLGRARVRRRPQRPHRRILPVPEGAHSRNLRRASAIERPARAILVRDPTLLEVRNMLALNQQRLGEHEAAARNLATIVQKDPLNSAAHLSLATSYSRLNRVAEASRELEAAITTAARAGSALEHVTIPAMEMLGAIRIREKQYDQARTGYTSLLNIAPGNYEAHYNLAWLDSRDGHPEQAQRHLEAAVQSEPRSSAAHNALGSIYLQQKDLERAGREFNEAVRLDPKSVFAHYNVALVLQLEGATDRAVAEFRKCLKLDPNFQPAHAALARLGLN